MKKNSLFKMMILLVACVGLSFTSNAQILFEDFSLMADSNTTDISASLDTYTTTTGWVGNKVYQATGKAKIGTSSVQGFITTPALDLSGNGGNFTIRFNAKKWGSDQSQIRVIVDQTEHIVSGLTNSSMEQFTLIANGGTTATTIKFSGYQSAGARFFIDNIEIFQSTDPALIFTPSALVFTNAELNNTVTENITISGQNLTAGQNITVAVSGNGFASTTTTLACNDLMAASGATLAVDFTPTAVENYTGTITFTGGGLESPVTYNLSGNGVDVISVATLAELRALAPSYTGASNSGTTIYKYTGEAIVTQTQTYNNVKYLEDETGAIMIFDQSGIIGSGVTRGTKVTDVMGTLSNYFGMIEFVPTADLTQISPFNTINYTVATLDQFDADYNNPLQAKVVKIEGVTFGAGTFATGTYYNLSQGAVSVDSVLYTDNYSADYIGTSFPTYTVDAMGVCLYKGSTSIPTKNRIVLFDLANDGMVGINGYSEALVSLSPNPANDFVNIVLTSNMTLNIYSVNGALVYTENLQEGTNTISVSNLKSGLYIINLIDDNSGSSRNSKLIIK